MKLQILILSLLIINFSLLFSQNTWVQTYDPFPGWQNPSYKVEDVVVCAEGGYAVNGTYNGFNGQEEFKWGFVVKTDCDGNMLWAKQDTIYNDLVHTTATGMIETTDGYIISVGYSPSFGTYLIKRDLEGNRIWRRTMTDFTIQSVDTTDNGNIILGGSQNLNIGLRKIDEEVNIIWTQVYPIADDYTVCNSIVSLQDGGYALTGFIDYEGRADFDVLVMKTDENGDSLWTRTYDAFGDHDQGNCIIENSTGDILVCGYFTDPSQLIIQGFIWYLNSIGNTQWIEYIDTETGASHFSLLNLTDDTYVAYCYKGLNGLIRQSSIYCFDINYNIQWQSIFDSNVAQSDRCIKQVPGGFICAFRDYGGTMYDNNIGLVKTDSLGNYTGIDDNIVNPQNVVSFYCYPNPFNPTISFEIKTDNLNNLQIKIYNIKGQLIEIIPIVEGNVSWNANNNASGIYLCKLINVETDKIQSVKKVTLLK